jgi:hypothetical protein
VVVLRRQAFRPGGDGEQRENDALARQRAAAMPLDPAEPIRQAVDAGVDEGTEGALATVGRFFGRPGYAFRSLLRGRVDDAAENVAQFFLDLPSGGWLNPSWSLANLFTETGDLTDKDERPEFTDLVGRTGDGLTDAAIDVLGGIITDPLTVLPFAGAAKAAGSAVVAAPRALAGARVASALAETAAGRKLAATGAAEALAAMTPKLARSSSPLGRLAARGELTVEALANPKLAETLGPKGAKIVAGLRGEVEARAAESVLRTATRSSAAEAAQAFRGVAEREVMGALGSSTRYSRVAQDIADGRTTIDNVVSSARRVMAIPGVSVVDSRANADLLRVWDRARHAATRATGFDEAGTFRRFGTTAEGGNPLLAGLRALEEGGATVPDGALTFRIPLIGMDPVVLTKGGAFGAAARALIPGKLATDALMAQDVLPGVKRMAIDLRALTDERATRALSWAKKFLYSKRATDAADTVDGMGGQAFEDGAILAGHAGARVLAKGATRIARAFDGVSTEQAQVLGATWLRQGDPFQAILAAGNNADELAPIERQIDMALGALGRRPVGYSKEGYEPVGNMAEDVLAVAGGRKPFALGDHVELSRDISYGVTPREAALREQAVGRALLNGTVVEHNVPGWGQVYVRPGGERAAEEALAAVDAHPRVAEPGMRNLLLGKALGYSDDAVARHIRESAGDQEWLDAVGATKEQTLRSLDVLPTQFEDGPLIAGTGLIRLPEALTRGYGANQKRVLGKLGLLAQEEAIRDGVRAGLTRERVSSTMSEYIGAMGEIADDLVRLGVWDAKTPNPFYAPFQAGKDVAGFLARKPDKKLGLAVLDVFTKRKQFKTIGEFEDHLRGVAAQFGINAPEGVVETSLAELMARRLAAHADTVERVTLQSDLRKRFPDARFADVVEQYLSRQFSEVSARDNVVTKLIGGGTILQKLKAQKLDEGDALEAVNAGKKVVPHPDGGLAVEKRWEGLNFYAKPALTLPFPAFYGRNVVSMVVSAAIDPDMGPKVASQILRSVWDAPILRALTARGAKGHTPDTAALIVRAVHDPALLTPEQQAILASTVIGKHPALEVIRLAREGVARKRYPDAGVIDAPGRLNELLGAATPEELRTLAFTLEGKLPVSLNAGLWEKLGAVMGRVRDPSGPAVGAHLAGKPGAVVQSFRNEVVKPLGQINAGIEDAARVGTFVRLVEGGMDPVRAQQRIDRVFVNYDVVSPTERTLRDLIPFARYAIGSVPVTLQNTARNAGGFFPAATRTLINRQPDEQFLPENVRGKAAIQLGVDREGNPIYASSLGLPFDVAGDALGLVGRAFQGGIKRGLLAGAQPQLRAAAEAELDTSFYFGGSPFAYRQAPRALPDALTTVTTLPSGKKVREVPGWVNHWLLGATPLSRFRSELDNLLDERLDPQARAIDALSGVRLQSVDQRTQARRAITRWLEEKEASGEVGKIEAFFMRGEGDEKLSQAIKALDALRKQDKARRAPKPAPGVR